MGNIFHCCRTLSSYFRRKDVRAEAERSPLLSSEESECTSPSLPDDLEDDLLSVSTSIPNLTLEPEHFLFPDIILSSNPAGEVTLVEPMVCLLVSEEEEGVMVVDELRDEGEERSRRYSEVETQTEAETQIGTGVQTQTESQAEVQTQTETFETVPREVNTSTNTGTRTEMTVDEWDEDQILNELDALLEIHSEINTDSQQKTASAEMELPGEEGTQANTLTTQTSHTERTAEVTEEVNTSDDQRSTVAAQEHTDFSSKDECSFLTHEIEKDKKQNLTSLTLTENKTNNIEEDTAAEETEIRKEDAETVENFDPTDCHMNQKQDNNNQPDEQINEATLITDQPANEKDFNNIHTVTNTNLSEGQKDQMADDFYSAQIQCEENLHLAEREEEDNRKDRQQVSESETPDLHLEDEQRAEMKRMTMFLVDKLFLAAPQIKVNHTEESSDNALVFDKDKTDQASIQDIVDLQENSFTVRIQPPGSEHFELQVSAQMLVVELHQVLMDHELTCHRTCFSLQQGGTTLDNLTELHSIQGIQDGAVIKIVEDSYTVRDARLHVRHVRDLLRSLDPADAYNGVNCSSLSFLTYYTRGDKESENVGRKASVKESVDCSPPEFILPGCKERPLTPLQPSRDDRKPLQCLRVLTMSSWNPPPGNRKMHGDLMYLNVVTMEDRELNITSSTRGFYLNQSTAFNFNPKPAVPKIFCHSLVELLNQVSPAFKKSFSVLQKIRVQQHPYERIAAPFQVFTWIAPHGDHALDCVRAEETHTSRMGQDEHTAGQSRDWNEELQGCRELPRTSLEERLNRERSVFKTNSDFVAAATRGAVFVVDGNIMPLNPGESPHMQMFMWNNIFFSLGFDVSEHYQPLGGNTAAHAAARCDLRGAQAYASVDIEGLHTLGAAVVDYHGVRVIAQTIVPGILERSHEQTVVYGSNDNGKTVHSQPKFLELLDKASKPLRIQRHKVLDHNNTTVELCSGIETIGIIGNDGRSYILDLLRTFPPDLNFQFSGGEKVKEDVPKECQSLGFPLTHTHSLASLRPELVEAFVQHKYELFMKIVSDGLNQLKEQNKSTEMSEELLSDTTNEEQTTSDAGLDCQKKNVIQRACKSVGSVSDSCFDIRFNSDVCSPGVRFSPDCTEDVQRQRGLLWDAAAFLLSSQIPGVFRDCLDHTALPMDGASLTSVLHQRGINVRYLGTILMQLDELEERERLTHLQRICVSELIIRGAKHIFKTYLQDVEPAAFSAAVSHFLNCLLGSSSCFTDSDELLSRRRSRRRKSHSSRVTSLTDSVWARLTSTELWVRVKAEVQDYYHYTIDSDCIDEVIEKYNLQRISLLREMAIKTGIQVQLREYMFESRHKPVFVEEDVINMFPVVCHLGPTSTDATRLMQQAHAAIEQGLFKDGYELIGQALTLFSSVCGVLHQDVCMCLRLLGRLSYISGDNDEALSHQEKVVMSSERVQGIDHPQTIQDYTYLALYYFAGSRHSTSLQLLYRARYLTLLVSGDDHPQLALLDSMLGLVLHGLMEYDLSLMFLLNALTLTSKYHGATSLKHAHSHHLLATVYESKGEFRSALQHEKEAFSIYKSQVGEKHDNTKESSEYLKSLTQQAVNLQKAINQIYSNTPSASVPPPKFSTPNLPSILRQLNLTCGIIFIHLSAKEIADLRTELKGKTEVEESENELLKQRGLKTVGNRQQY